MKKLTATLAAGALMVGAAAAQGQQQDYGPFPYNYVYANYAMTDASSGGFELGGSVELTDSIHAFAAWQDWELGNNFDRRTWQLGAGYRWGLAPNADVIAHVAYADSRLSRPGPLPSVSNNGAIVGGTVRGWITRNTELTGSVLLDRSLRNGTDAVLEFGGQYFMNDTFSIGGRLRLDDDDSTLFLGGRYHFGRVVNLAR